MTATPSITISFCPTCGVGHKYLATCKRCGATAIRGTMEEMAARQSAFTASQPVTVAPVAPVVASDYLAQYRAAEAEKRAAERAKSGRIVRAPWQRKCTCGHCMTCIGE